MPKVFNLTWTCPYYKKHEELKISCNCGEIIFPDKKSTGSYAVDFCASFSWGECSLAKARNEYYERKNDEESRADKEIRKAIRNVSGKK